MTRYRWAVAGTLVLALTALVAAGTAGGAHKQRGVSGNISIIAKWTGDEQKSFEAVLDAFKKANPDVKVTYQGAGDDAPQVISTAIAGGNPPDIGTMPQPGTMADFAKGGKLKPITFAQVEHREALRPVLGQPRDGQREAVRPVLQGIPEVDRLVQRQVVQERGRQGDRRSRRGRSS